MTFVYIALAIAGIPFVYYTLALVCSLSFFRKPKPQGFDPFFLPPVSVLKPIRGLDPDAYNNYSSFCRQDYPEYEVVFCVDLNDPAVPILERLKADFPECNIRLLFGSGQNVINDKVGRLIRLTRDAQYDLFVITDGDVRVKPDYLRSVVWPLVDPKTGVVTCLYTSVEEKTLVESIQSISMISDFFAGVLVAWKLDGVKFALAQTIVTRRDCIAAFGGYEFLQSRPADDLYIGRLASELGLGVVLLPYAVQTVPDFRSITQFFRKRLRWMTVMRHMRPAGHFGLLFTWGLPWSLLAITVRPTLPVAIIYLGGYLIFRVAITWSIGVRGVRQAGAWAQMPLIPIWDLIAFALWLISFGKKMIGWRGVNYILRDGRLTICASDVSETDRK